MAEAKGKKVSRLPKDRKGKGKPSEPKLKKKTVRALNEAYNRRKDWMKMSKKQLAVWLYKHRGSAHKTFYR